MHPTWMIGPIHRGYSCRNEAVLAGDDALPLKQRWSEALDGGPKAEW
jgi:hypothetical protein